MSRYQIIQQIAHDGMGPVYQAKDTQNGQTVTLQELLPQNSALFDIDRYIRQMSALTRLDHPNILKLLDEVQVDDKRYLVWQQAEGKDLSQIIGQPMAFGQVIAIGVDIANAMASAHSMGVLHQAIRPANIILQADGKAVVTGFTPPKSQDYTPEDEVFAGAVQYFSPEYVQGGAFDEKSDIWALGVVLYELVAGVRPFDGLEVVMKIIQSEVQDIREHRLDTPTALANLIHEMLKKDPAERIDAMRKVRLELRLLQSNQSTTGDMKPVPGIDDEEETEVMARPPEFKPKTSPNSVTSARTVSSTNLEFEIIPPPPKPEPALPDPGEVNIRPRLMPEAVPGMGDAAPLKRSEPVFDHGSLVTERKRRLPMGMVILVILALIIAAIVFALTNDGVAVEGTSTPESGLITVAMWVPFSIV